MFGVTIIASAGDEALCRELTALFGPLTPAVRVIFVDRASPGLPDDGYGQPGMLVVVVGRSFIDAWFGGLGWADQLSAYHRRGGIGLLLHPDGITGPLPWPALDMAAYPPPDRRQVLQEFLDLPRALALRLDADDGDPGALEHARGLVAWDRGDTAAAIACFERAIGAREDQHPCDLRLAASKNALGVALTRAGRPADAIAPLRESLDVRRTTAGRASPHAAVTANNLGAALLETGDGEEAASAFIAAAESLHDLPDTYRERARAAAAHAQIACMKVGRDAEAAKWAERAGQGRRGGDPRGWLH